MQPPSRRRGPFVLAVVLAGGLSLAACGSSSPTQADGKAPGTSATTFARPVAAADCSGTAFQAALVKDFPAGKATDGRCAEGKAVATVRKVETMSSDMVVVLSDNAGTWSLVAKADANADPKTFLPSDVPRSLWETWQRTYAPPAVSKTTIDTLPPNRPTFQTTTTFFFPPPETVPGLPIDPNVPTASTEPPVV